MEPVMRAAVKEAKKYRSRGGRTVLARVEPLVLASAPHEISVTVPHLRSERNEELRALYEKALASYRVRILDSIDLDRLPDFRSRAAVVARAMIDRGDARAFAIGRRMLRSLGAA
jgi:hypothetical protein